MDELSHLGNPIYSEMPIFKAFPPAALMTGRRLGTHGLAAPPPAKATPSGRRTFSDMAFLPTADELK